MLVRPADENQTALSLSELRNIQKKQMQEIMQVRFQQIGSKRKSEIS